MTDGLTYDEREWRGSRVHMLTVDLTKRSMAPVMVGQDFPLTSDYRLDNRPAALAKAAGARATVGGGYEMTVYHRTGVTGQPLHALVVDREIWTTGSGAGGHGFLTGDGFATVRSPNRIHVQVWAPAPGGTDPILVEHVNRGHDGKVVAFTPRGGTNEWPEVDKHYAWLGNPGEWIEEGEAMHRTMTVIATGDTSPTYSLGWSSVLESRWGLGLHVGDQVTWTQHLGAPGVRHIVSGATGLLISGENIVNPLEMRPEASHGPDAWYVRRNPRTALGASADGKTAYLVAVEGRVPGSKGLRLHELATMLKEYGVSEAENMDGGGSTMMWVRGLGKNGLVADSCYGDGTYAGTRPDHFATAVF